KTDGKKPSQNPLPPNPKAGQQNQHHSQFRDLLSRAKDFVASSAAALVSERMYRFASPDSQQPSSRNFEKISKPLNLHAFLKLESLAVHLASGQRPVFTENPGSGRLSRYAVGPSRIRMSSHARVRAAQFPYLPDLKAVGPPRFDGLGQNMRHEDVIQSMNRPGPRPYATDQKTA
ncbi:hypothetical protein SAMN05880561_1041, partial [Rhizobium sp. RU33A]|uniref:hypothetical protein n=1 Tax=Rhizobium sp. RU33A TaxID=1907413 RepID=UPI0009561AFD